MVTGIAVGIIGIIFACKWKWYFCYEKKKNEYDICGFVAQVDGFMTQSSNSNVNGTSVSYEMIWLNGWILMIFIL